MTTGAILCTEVEGIGFRTVDLIGEGIVVHIAVNDTYERVVVRFVVGLTYQRYLQFGIAYRPERTPVALETISRSTCLQRERDLQRIDDIDVLTAYLHIPRTGWTSRSGNGVCRTTDTACGIIAFAVKITCIGDEVESLIGFPFQAATLQVGHVGLLFAAAINHLITHQHRVFLVRLIGRLDSYRHAGIITEDDGIAAWVSAVVEQAVLLIQITPRENGSTIYAIYQYQLSSATACQPEFQPFISAVPELHKLFFIGIVVGTDLDIVIGQQR